MTTKGYPPPSESWAVSYGCNGWEAHQTPRGTLTRADATAKAERKNAADAARQARFSKRGRP